MSGSTASEATVEIVLRRLRKRVAKAGWTQRRVAAEAPGGVSYSYLNKILGGKTPFKVSHIATVLIALDVPPGEFFLELASLLGHPRQGELGEAAAAALERSVVGEVRGQEDLVIGALPRRRPE